MEKMNYDLSDGLFKLRRSLSDAFPSGGVVLDDEQTDMLVKLLKELGLKAGQLENEVSRHRWNEPALREQIAELQTELARPGTNVTLFPVISRPQPAARPYGPGGAA